MENSPIVDDYIVTSISNKFGISNTYSLDDSGFSDFKRNTAERLSERIFLSKETFNNEHICDILQEKYLLQEKYIDYNSKIYKT